MFPSLQPVKHFRIVNKVTTVGGGDTLTNSGAKPFVFFDQTQGSLGHQLSSVDAIVLSDLGKPRFLVQE